MCNTHNANDKSPFNLKKNHSFKSAGCDVDYMNLISLLISDLSLAIQVKSLKLS